MIRKKRISLCKLASMRKDKRSEGKRLMKSKGRILVEENLKVPRIRLIKGVRAAATKMVVKETFEVKRRGLTKAESIILSVKGLVIL